MATIQDIILAPAIGAFFYDDQTAIRGGLEHDGFDYRGGPVTPGFTRVRQPAQALSVGVLLDDGAVCWGDMVSVQYSGAAGRDPLFNQEQIAELTRAHVQPALIGRDSGDALGACNAALENASNDPLPLAIKYGVSQALIAAAAHSSRTTMTEVICDIFNQPIPTKPIPIFAQSGDDRYNNVDKMVLKRVDVLPHGLINSAEKFGPGGSVFCDYVEWVANRARELGGSDYQPVLHFDLYGWIGFGYSKEPAKVAEFIARCADRVPDFQLQIESPVDYGERQQQIDRFAEIVRCLDSIGASAKIVADEHCNNFADIVDFCDARAAHFIQVKTPDVGSLLDTARAIQYAKAQKIGAYCGGTCAETDISARACVHVALAMQADMMLAKPGMGVDEAICIVGNEQSRALEQLAATSV